MNEDKNLPVDLRSSKSRRYRDAFLCSHRGRVREPRVFDQCDASEAADPSLRVVVYCVCSLGVTHKHEVELISF